MKSFTPTVILTLLLLFAAFLLLAIGYLITGKSRQRSSCGGMSVKTCSQNKDGTCDICKR